MNRLGLLLAVALCSLGAASCGSEPVRATCRSVCSGTCVDLQNDNANCGACGTACPSGQVCTAGACAAACATPLSACGSGCADLRNDPANCGTCGHACGSTEACLAGSCTNLCQAANMQGNLCGNICVDIKTDNANCGACGHVCGAGTACSSGSCVVTCAASQVSCGGVCVDPQKDSAHCGAKGACSSTDSTSADYQGAACAPGNVCTNGACVLSCLASEVKCGASCVDPQSDGMHCGAKGTCSSADTTSADYQGEACASGNVCSNGACVRSCLASEVKCGTSCIDPLTDRNHCGASGACSSTDAGTADSQGAQCASGTVCAAGACTVSCLPSQVNCGGTCIDPQTNRTHCGASGACSAPDAGTTDYQGETCVSGNVCAAGACTVSCLPNQVNCGGTCIDPLTNRSYCGASGTCTAADAGTADYQGAQCASGNVCTNGACAASCVAGQLKCGTSCIDPLTDRTYCGATLDCAGTNDGTVCGPLEACVSGTCRGFTSVFNATGAPQTFVVPAGITSLAIDAYGARGGGGGSSSAAARLGGLGAHVRGVFAVTPGETLTVFVGGAGTDEGVGGYNGGGGYNQNWTWNGGGGGGASDVRRGAAALADRMIVAAGGGGCPGGANAYYVRGGAGGCATGGDGTDGTGTPPAAGGSGATQTAGGAGGTGAPGVDGNPGQLGLGGVGGIGGQWRGCGGGGGYYGGGGGEGFSAPGTPGGGGGGSSYWLPSAKQASCDPGYQAGNGRVIISVP